MCGILLLARETATASSSPTCFSPVWSSGLEDKCRCRGPHAHDTLERASDSLSLRLTTSVLSLRGDDLTSQPFVSPDDRYFFAWNGQVYSINEVAERSAWAAERLGRGENDGRILFDWFCDAAHEKGLEVALQEVFAYSTLQDAEWAMVLVDTYTGSVYFGRDALGRRSLLVSQKDGELILASVASHEAIDASLAFKEVDCSSLWQWQLGHLTTLMSRNAERLLLCPTDTFADPTDSERQAALDSIQAALFESVRRRVTTVQGITAQEKAPPIAILFSGGLDCTILAYLAHQVVPESQGIDLINVAFENPRVLAAGKKAGSNSSSPSASSSFDTPDRLLSRRSLSQLQSLAPDRLWNLVEIDVHYSSYLAHKPTILSIMHPSESVMDLSLASVLYFASKGSAHSIGPRVYISGLGADELFGGYSRHRGAFASGGWARAVDELQMDLDRLPTRNLGRDDRALSSHGREARYPFLAAPVLQLAARLPVRIKAEWGRGEGVGDKLLLRMLARERLGLGEVGREKKRAMQFGARSAKMEVGASRAKGHHSVAREAEIEEGEGTDAECPSEVFTTLCYDDRGEVTVDDLLRPIMRVKNASTAAATKSDLITTTAIQHPLHAHIPLLLTHLIRLRTSTLALARTWPTRWGLAAQSQSADGWAKASLDHLASELAKGSGEKRRVRWSVGREGQRKVVQASMAPPAAEPLVVRLDTQTTSITREELLVNKTDRRSMYDEARARVNATLGMPSSSADAEKQPVFDVLLWMRCDGKRLLTESSIANVILERKDGQLVTPKLRVKEGVAFLPGLMREEALRRGLVVEEGIEIDDEELLSGRVKIWLCNALRGVFEVRLVP